MNNEIQPALPLSDEQIIAAMKPLGARLADLLDDDKWNNIEPMLLDAGRACAALTQAAPQAEWIPVAERLPEPWKHVALIDIARWENMPGDYDANIHAAGYWNPQLNGFWSVRSERAVCREAFTHWCSLPPAPEATPNTAEKPE